MREIALDLAARGFKVFPIAAGKKSPPLITSWQTQATTEPTTIQSWWVSWPNANVGIHCDGLAVIDVDPKNDGPASLAVLQQEEFLEETYEVVTPSGGTHLYYRCPAGIAVPNIVSTPERPGPLGAGLDVRSTGGYVVAAGSTTTAGYYAVACGCDIAELDPSILARLKSAPAKPDRPSNDAPPIPTDPDVAAQRAIEYLSSLETVSEGGRNVACLNAARKIADFGVTKDQAVPIMIEHFRSQPPMEEAEIITTVRSSYNNREKPVGAESPEGMGFEYIPSEGAEPSAPSTPATPTVTELLHPSGIEPDDVLKAEYLVKHVIDRESNALLYGKWSVGKTFVVLDIAASIAIGKPWFGQRVRKGRVLYLGYEGMRAMKKRMIALREKYPQLKTLSTPFRWAQLHNPLTQPDGKAQLQQRVHKFKKLHGGPPDLIIIDPLMNALGGDDSDAKLMGELNLYINSIMRVEKCTVLRVHHTGHGSEERARGHSSLPAGVDTEIRVDRDNITMTKQKDDESLKFDWDLKVVDVGVDTDGDPVRTCVVEHLEENPASPKLTRTLREIMKRVVEQFNDGAEIKIGDFNSCCPENMNPEQRVKVRNDLVRKGWLSKQGDGFVVHANGPAPQFESL